MRTPRAQKMSVSGLTRIVLMRSVTRGSLTPLLFDAIILVILCLYGRSDFIFHADVGCFIAWVSEKSQIYSIDHWVKAGVSDFCI